VIAVGGSDEGVVTKNKEETVDGKGGKNDSSGENAITIRILAFWRLGKGLRAVPLRLLEEGESCDIPFK